MSNWANFVSRLTNLSSQALLVSKCRQVVILHGLEDMGDYSVLISAVLDKVDPMMDELVLAAKKGSDVKGWLMWIS